MFEPQYTFASLEEFADTADQIASVEVTEITRGTVTDLEDEILEERIVRLRVVEPIKGVELGADLSVADGLYSRVRDRETGEFGPDVLQLVTEGVELTKGSTAVVGLLGGELLSMGVFPLVDGQVVDTDRTAELYRSVEGQSAEVLIENLKAATAG